MPSIFRQDCFYLLYLHIVYSCITNIEVWVLVAIAYVCCTVEFVAGPIFAGRKTFFVFRVIDMRNAPVLE